MSQIAKFTLDGTVFEFDMATMRNLEAIELEAKSGMTVIEWQQALGEMRAEAVRALVWMAGKRMGYDFGCKYSELDFDLMALANSLEVEGDAPDPTPAANRAARRSAKKSSPTPH